MSPEHARYAQKLPKYDVFIHHTVDEIVLSKMPTIRHDVKNATPKLVLDKEVIHD